jgi:hypothetical protein
MSGDKLTILVGLLSTMAAAGIAALTVKGWPRRLLSVLAVAFGIAAFVFATAQPGAFAFRVIGTLWGMSPMIGLVLVLAVTTQRQLVERPNLPTPPQPPKFNPAITAAYLNEIVNGATDLDAKRKLATLKNQTAQFKGQIDGISEDMGGNISAYILGLQSRSQGARSDRIVVDFKREHAAALEALKPGEWMEFRGEVRFSSVYGWALDRADFISRADPPLPKAVKRPRNRSNVSGE